jgi:hypothetical protein
MWKVTGDDRCQYLTRHFESSELKKKKEAMSDIKNNNKVCYSDLRQVGGFLRVLWFPPPKTLTATI